MCLFLIVSGGTAYATHPGGTNTVSSGDIINGQVRTPDLRDQEVTASKLAPNSVGTGNLIDAQVRSQDIRNDAVNINKLAPNAVGTNKVVDGSLTGDDVDEAELVVPLRRGEDVAFNFDETVTVLTLPGIGAFLAECEEGHSIVTFRNDSGNKLTVDEAGTGSDDSLDDGETHQIFDPRVEQRAIGGSFGVPLVYAVVTSGAIGPDLENCDVGVMTVG